MLEEFFRLLHCTVHTKRKMAQLLQTRGETFVDSVQSTQERVATDSNVGKNVTHSLTVVCLSAAESPCIVKKQE